MWTIKVRGAESSMHNGRAKMPIYLAEAVGLDFNLIRTF